MKIGYVLTFFPKLSETFILNEIVEVIKRGHQVTIFALSQTYENIIHSDVNKYDLPNNVHYLPDPKIFTNKIKLGLKALGSWGWNYPSESLGYKVVSIAATKYFSRVACDMSLDILHAHFNGNPTQVAMLMSKRLGIPFTFTTHAYDIFINLNPKPLITRLNESTQMMTVSNWHKNYLENLKGINGKKITVVHSCPNLDIIDQILKDDQSGKSINLITVSRLVEKKGIKYAIQALHQMVSQYPDLKYTIVGDGPLKSDLVKLTNKLGLEKNVYFTGAATNTNALKQVREADIFVLPCIKAKNGDLDGVPTVLMEAMALKVPVISTNVAGIPELITNNQEGFLVKTHEVGQLVTAIQRLMENKVLRIKMGNQGRVKIEKDFNVHKEIGKVLDIWTSAL